jgi:hypothetical protein
VGDLRHGRVRHLVAVVSGDRAADTSRLVFLDPQELAAPRNGVNITYVDHWWIANAWGQIAVWRTPYSRRRVSVAAQCNTTEAIVKRFGWGTGLAVCVPSVSLPYDSEDGAFLPDSVATFDIDGNPIEVTAVPA